MIKMLKHLGKSAMWIPLIVALLTVQAFCDLALPQYTSDIVDVGIQPVSYTHLTLPTNCT